MNVSVFMPHLNESSMKSSMSSDRSFFQNLQRYAYGYIMIIICGAGLLGNVLAFVVLSRKSMRSSNSATYLRCLSAVDACVLLLAILRYRSYYVLLSEASVINMVLNFDPYVQVYITPFFWVALGVSSFITLSLSIERYLAIRWPLTLKHRCSKQMVWACIALITTGVFLVTFPHFLCYRLKTARFGNTSVVAIKLINTYLDARTYLHAYNHYVLPIIWYMVPWVIVAVFNLLLSIQVQKSTRIRVGASNLVNLNRNLSILIILIVGMYMVCHFPRCILAFYCLVNHCSASGMGEDVNTKAYYILVAAADILNILNSCLNIVVYCMTGSRFRQEVKQLLLCRLCSRHAVIHPANNTLHVSLQQVPATPMDDRKSFNMSFKELQLAPSNLPSPSQSTGDLRPTPTKLSSTMSLKDSCNAVHSSLVLSPNRQQRVLKLDIPRKRKPSIMTLSAEMPINDRLAASPVKATHPSPQQKTVAEARSESNVSSDRVHSSSGPNYTSTSVQTIDSSDT